MQKLEYFEHVNSSCHLHESNAHTLSCLRYRIANKLICQVTSPGKSSIKREVRLVVCKIFTLHLLLTSKSKIKQRALTLQRCDSATLRKTTIVNILTIIAPCDLYNVSPSQCRDFLKNVQAMFFFFSLRGENCPLCFSGHLLSAGLVPYISPRGVVPLKWINHI